MSVVNRIAMFLRRNIFCRFGAHCNMQYDSGLPSDIGRAGTCLDCGDRMEGVKCPPMPAVKRCRSGGFVPPRRVMRRIGRLSYATELTNSMGSCAVFQRLSFTPLHTEHIQYIGQFESVGLSPLFDETREGERPPEYEIIVLRDDSCYLPMLIVTVERV